jgi:hypothetical protein
MNYFYQFLFTICSSTLIYPLCPTWLAFFCTVLILLIWSTFSIISSCVNTSFNWFQCNFEKFRGWFSPFYDMFPTSFIDSNGSLIVKITKEQEVGARSLPRSTLGDRGACWSSGMRTRKSDKHHLLTRTCTNQTTSWLMHSLSIFGVRTSHRKTRTHKTHHGLDLGEVTTFPLIVYFLPLHEAHI